MSLSHWLALGLTLWLIVLTALAVGLVRDLGGVLMLIRGLGGSTGPGEQWGPDEGTQLSQHAMQLLQPARDGRSALVLVSSHCGSCLHLIEQLSTWNDEGLAVVVDGEPGALADALRRLPAHTVSVDGVAGAQLHDELGSPPTPFAIVLDGTTVAGSALLTGGVHYLRTLLNWDESVELLSPRSTAAAAGTR